MESGGELVMAKNEQKLMCDIKKKTVLDIIIKKEYKIEYLKKYN